MTNRYDNLIDVLTILNNHAGKKVLNFAKAFPEEINDCFGTRKEYCNVMQDENSAWVYTQSHKIKTVTYNKNAGVCVPGDCEVTFYYDDAELKSLPVGAEDMAISFSEVIMMLEKENGEKIYNICSYDLMMKKLDHEGAFGFDLYESNRSEEYKLIASERIVIGDLEK